MAAAEIASLQARITSLESDVQARAKELEAAQLAMRKAQTTSLEIGE